MRSKNNQCHDNLDTFPIYLYYLDDLLTTLQFNFVPYFDIWKRQVKIYEKSSCWNPINLIVTMDSGGGLNFKEKFRTLINRGGRLGSDSSPLSPGKSSTIADFDEYVNSGFLAESARSSRTSAASLNRGRLQGMFLFYRFFFTASMYCKCKRNRS